MSELAQETETRGQRSSKGGKRKQQAAMKHRIQDACIVSLDFLAAAGARLDLRKELPGLAASGIDEAESWSSLGVWSLFPMGDAACSGSVIAGWGIPGAARMVGLRAPWLFTVKDANAGGAELAVPVLGD
ncbi:hypothetical protein SRHO_G00299160 [Serrasalmus rhombeus]